MRQLSDDRIRQYQECYLRAYGEPISFEEARIQAEDFARLLRIIYLKESDLDLPSL